MQIDNNWPRTSFLSLFLFSLSISIFFSLFLSFSLIFSLSLSFSLLLSPFLSSSLYFSLFISISLFSLSISLFSRFLLFLLFVSFCRSVPSEFLRSFLILWQPQYLNLQSLLQYRQSIVPPLPSVHHPVLPNVRTMPLLITGMQPSALCSIVILPARPVATNEGCKRKSSIQGGLENTLLSSSGKGSWFFFEK